MHGQKLKLIAIILIILGVLASAGFLILKRNIFDIEKGSVDLEGMNFSRSDLAGIRCENARARPVAVMLASDPEARPIAGLAEADFVLEMPVTDGGVTRLMAVFQCYQPKEIGSIRSSRLDFIPLVRGLDAVYAHWGGEKEALTELSRGVVDNIDAMKYEGTFYYRKSGLKQPHNGFTSFELLQKAIVNLDYTLGRLAAIYPSGEDKNLGQISPPSLYQGKFQVDWRYDHDKNVYRRWRDGKPEVDRNDNRQIEAKNIIVLHTGWSPINKDYIRIQTVGSGEITVYQNGEAIIGSWEKKSPDSKLYFYDNSGQEIKFTPGQIWVEIVV